MDSALVMIQMLNGLQLGVLLFLLAAGLTLVFGIMDFINLAHGAFYMLGAFICATLALWLGLLPARGFAGGAHHVCHRSRGGIGYRPPAVSGRSS